MGLYINKGNTAFRESRNSEYVDKSWLIAVINKTLFTEQRFTCVSRSRRFGKSMAAEMLAAYYDKSCDSRELFSDLKIAKDPSFEKHLNKYSVICIDMAELVAEFRDGDIVGELDSLVLNDVRKTYPDIDNDKNCRLMEMLFRVVEKTGHRFIVIIDEWDAICREFPSSSPMMTRYVDWLRKMFKSLSATSVFAGVYMTGILPIKKYNTQLALNLFEEYSVTDPGDMASFFGFTKSEVIELSEKHGMDYSELEKWYDGYKIGDEEAMFNPNSVMAAIRRRRCSGYWRNTASYDAIVPYIRMNYDGLKDDILRMLAGGRSPVDPTGFQNDLSVINSKDDALTVLIHLGYLSYDRDRQDCFVPNLEVAGEMEKAVRAVKWPHVTEALEKSRKLLDDTLECKADAVAAGISLAHDENTSILSYNDENSMACVLSIAYYYARNNYIIHREYTSGGGFADLVMIPRKNVDTPALIVELKYNKDADTAIDQIRRRNYPAKVAEYADNLLLVGINYDKETKSHSCVIEKA